MKKKDKRQWERYIKHLLLWAIAYEDKMYEYNSPACYDEFCENDDEPEYYNNELDYNLIRRDFNKRIDKWEKNND